MLAPKGHMTKFIYILKLEKGKYYVGTTSDLQQRLREHRQGHGSSWTNKYKPIRIEKSRKVNGSPGLDEDKETKECMKKYGIKNVRGGSYCSFILPNEQYESLYVELLHAENRCSRCRRTGHYIRDCYANTYVNGDIIEESKRYCRRCGRDGHVINQCYASTYVNGDIIEESKLELS